MTRVGPEPQDGPFEEAVLRLERLRRRRWLRGAGRPLLLAAAVALMAWVAVPTLLQLLLPRSGLPRDPRWMGASLLAAAGLAAMVAGYVRGSQLWTVERRLGMLDSWVLARMRPDRVVASAWLASTTLAMLLVAVPAIVGAGLAVAAGTSWWQALEALALVVLAAAAGAAAGGAAFFLSLRLAPRLWLWLGVALLSALAAAAWFQIESSAGGWRGEWEKHPSRLLGALTLLTPAAATYAAASPVWWGRHVAAPFGLPAGWEAGCVYGGLLALASLGCAHVCRSGYRRLASAPDLLERAPAAASLESGREERWPGVGNPVWTRELRTRLRGREAAELVLVASLAIASGAFIPLLMALRDLSDPLQTAGVARQVFYWLTLTLMGLLVLVTPRLGAEAIAAERQKRTLDLLIATPLLPREILSGKLLGAACVVLLLMTPSLPLFSLCYLFRGASGAQVVEVYGLLFATTLVAGLAGVTASALYARPAAAQWQAYLLSLLLVAVPGGAFWLAARIAAPAPEMRQSMGADRGGTFVLMLVCGVALWLLWRNAADQLRYAEG